MPCFRARLKGQYLLQRGYYLTGGVHMAGSSIILPWGNDELSLVLPEDWEVLKICEPGEARGVPDIAAEARRALSSPVGSPRLAEMARAAKKALLVTDDIARPTPVHLFLPFVLEELERAGISKDKITVITALGVHRAMTAEEMASKVGAEQFAGLEWVNHRYDDPNELVSLGKTARGTPVSFNRRALESDLIVSLGSIEPHVIAGFGGGHKNLFPGIAGAEAIGHNHKLNARPETFNMVGVPPEQNPMRLDLEEAAGMIGKPVFIVNAVLNGALEVTRLVAGHPVEAHREGVRASAAIFGVPVPGRADVVICNSYPMDADFRQAAKALANTIRAVRPGGIMVTFLRTEHGLGDAHLPNITVRLGKKGMRLLARILLPIVGRLRLVSSAENNFMVYFALQSLRRNDLIFYAPGLPPELGRKLRFLEIHHRIEDAMESAHRAHPSRASVLIFPKGGMTYPILKP